MENYTLSNGQLWYWLASFLQMFQCQTVTKVNITHPEGDLNECTKFHGNPPDMSLKCQPHGGARLG